MKKILFSAMAVVLCLGLMGAAFAYFSDTETSSGNTFTAGTIDLAVNDENPWTSVLFTIVDVKPCEDVDPFSVKFENVGNNPGILYTCIKYNELDKYVNPEPDYFEFREMELDADQFAAIVYVAAVTYQYECPPYYGSVQDDLSNWLLMDSNGDGKVSLYELKQASPIPYDPTGAPLPATATIEWDITFHMADSLTNWGDVTSAIVTGVEDNVPQADGVEIIVSGILLQVGAPSPTCP